MNMPEIIAAGLFGLTSLIGSTLAILHIISIKSNSRWFCDKMGWHKTPKSIGFDGCSETGKCPRCGKEVLCDSQGNWF